MEQPSSDTSDKQDNSDFIFSCYKVIGIIDDPKDCKTALRGLRATGFTADEINVLTGEEGAHRIDVTGEEHGWLPSIVRVQKLLGDYEPVPVRRHEQELLAGHFGIRVTAVEREGHEKVREILKSHGGHFINFYGQLAMEVLEP
jgi:hypothetical protein